MPEILSFRPYTSSNLQSIVSQRLQRAHHTVLDPIAISLAAKKVAAGSGDARLMLDVCNEAHSRLLENSNEKAISVVSTILNNRGALSAAVDVIKQLPVQQQIALCVAANATLLPSKSGALRSKATLGGLYQSFVSLCAKVHVNGLSFNEFADVCCNALAHHGLVDVPQRRGRGSTASAKTLRGRAVRLKVPVEDVRAGVADKGFLPLLVKKA